VTAVRRASCCDTPDAHGAWPCPWVPGATVIAWTHHDRQYLGIVTPPHQSSPGYPDRVQALSRPDGQHWMLPHGTAIVIHDPSGRYRPGHLLGWAVPRKPPPPQYDRDTGPATRTDAFRQAVGLTYTDQDGNRHP
jgi:hypothetical protein